MSRRRLKPLRLLVLAAVAALLSQAAHSQPCETTSFAFRSGFVERGGKLIRYQVSSTDQRIRLTQDHGATIISCRACVGEFGDFVASSAFSLGRYDFDPRDAADPWAAARQFSRFEGMRSLRPTGRHVILKAGNASGSVSEYEAPGSDGSIGKVTLFRLSDGCGVFGGMVMEAKAHTSVDIETAARLLGTLRIDPVKDGSVGDLDDPDKQRWMRPPIAPKAGNLLAPLKPSKPFEAPSVESMRRLLQGK